MYGRTDRCKKVVSNAQTDTTTYEFKVEFTFAAGADIKDMTAKHSTSDTITTSTDDKTYTFTLTNGESVIFENIPPYTEYTITEKDISKQYILSRVRDHSTDDRISNLLADDSN